MKTHFLAVLLLFSTLARAGDPGFLIVVGEPPVALQVTLPASSPSKFSYNPARISIWNTVTRDNLIQPDAEFTAAAVAGDSEPDCDVDLLDFSGFQRCFTGSGAGPPDAGCELFDFEPDGDVDLTDFGLLHGNLSGPETCAPVSLTVFVEGLTASAGLGDTTIDVLADPGGGGTFQLQETHAVTVVSIDVSPLSGPLGTAVTMTMQPAIPPIAFNTATAADWSGVFQPVVGPPSSSFTVAYSTDEFRESSPGTAVLIVGQGSGVPALPSGGVPPGTFVGSMEITLPGHVLTRSLNFAVSTSAVQWFAVVYAEDDELGYLGDPPTLDTTPRTELPLYDVPSGGAVPEFVEVAFFYHTACVVRIDENTITSVEAPPTLVVDLVSFDSNSAEVDRVEDVVLTLDTDDGDPDLVTYHSDLATPVVFVEGTIDPAMFSNVIIVQAAEDGFVIAVEGQP